MAELDFLASSHQLGRRAKLTAAVRPLSLPRGKTQVRPGEVCSVAGWGQLAPKGRFPDTLQEVELTVQQDEVCESYFRNYFNSTTQLCVGDPKDKKSSFQVRLGVCLAWLWEMGVLGPTDPGSGDSFTPQTLIFLPRREGGSSQSGESQAFWEPTRDLRSIQTWCCVQKMNLQHSAPCRAQVLENCSLGVQQSNQVAPQSWLPSWLNGSPSMLSVSPTCLLPCP